MQPRPLQLCVCLCVFVVSGVCGGVTLGEGTRRELLLHGTLQANLMVSPGVVVRL